MANADNKGRLASAVIDIIARMLVDFVEEKDREARKEPDCSKVRCQQSLPNRQNRDVARGVSSKGEDTGPWTP